MLYGSLVSDDLRCSSCAITVCVDRTSVCLISVECCIWDPQKALPWTETPQRVCRRIVRQNPFSGLDCRPPQEVRPPKNKKIAE